MFLVYGRTSVTGGLQTCFRASGGRLLFPRQCPFFILNRGIDVPCQTFDGGRQLITAGAQLRPFGVSLAYKLESDKGYLSLPDVTGQSLNGCDGHQRTFHAGQPVNMPVSPDTRFGNRRPAPVTEGEFSCHNYALLKPQTWQARLTGQTGGVAKMRTSRYPDAGANQSRSHVSKSA